MSLQIINPYSPYWRTQELVVELSPAPALSQPLATALWSHFCNKKFRRRPATSHYDALDFRHPKPPIVRPLLPHDHLHTQCTRHPPGYAVSLYTLVLY